MTLQRRRPALAPASRLVLWCLLLALPLYALSASLADMLGARHFHARATSVATLHPPDAMAGWRDFRRAVGGDAPAARAAPTATHTRLARHHHHPGEAGVVVVDAGDQAGSGTAEDGSAPAGMAALALALGAEPAAPLSPADPGPWPDTDAVGHTSHGDHRLDRPPKG